MKSRITFAGLAALAAAAALTAPPAPAQGLVECPSAVGGFADPWLLVGIEDPNERLADRNGDGLICSSTLRVAGRDVGRVLTDNSIGNPNIIPPGPCTDPFAPVAIGNPGIFPVLRELDANADGTLCGTASLEARALSLVLVDNPNAIWR